MGLEQSQDAGAELRLVPTAVVVDDTGVILLHPLYLKQVFQ